MNTTVSQNVAVAEPPVSLPGACRTLLTFSVRQALPLIRALFFSVA